MMEAQHLNAGSSQTGASEVTIMQLHYRCSAGAPKTKGSIVFESREQRESQRSCNTGLDPSTEEKIISNLHCLEM